MYELPILSDYLVGTNRIRTLDPHSMYQRRIKLLCEAHRHIDWHADRAVAFRDNPLASAAAAHCEHLRDQQIWLDQIKQHESVVPKIEIDNAIKQLHKLNGYT